MSDQPTYQPTPKRAWRCVYGFMGLADATRCRYCNRERSEGEVRDRGETHATEGSDA